LQVFSIQELQMLVHSEIQMIKPNNHSSTAQLELKARQNEIQLNESDYDFGLDFEQSLELLHFAN